MPSRTEPARSLIEEDYPGLGRYVWRPGTGALEWSPGLIRIYGRENAPGSEAEFMACLHPEDRTRIEGETEAFLTSGADSYSHSFRIIRPDGEVRYIIDRARIDRDSRGQVTAIHGMNMDVSDFPHLARASMDAESRLAEAASLLRGFGDRERLELGQRVSGLVLADINYRSGTVDLSAAAAQLYGLGDTAMSVDRETVHATFHPNDRAALADDIAAAHDPETGGRLATEHRVIHPDGSVRWLQVHKQIDFKIRNGKREPEHGILAAVDITDRKTAETDLFDSEQRLSLAQEVSGIGVWDLDVPSGAMVWTEGLYKLLGLDPSTPGTVPLFFDHVHPDERDEVSRAFQSAIKDGSLYESEFRIKRADGAMRHLKGRGRVVEEAEGTPLRMIGVNYDITKRKQAEERLRESETRVRTIIDETLAMVGILDPDGTLREVNRRALEFGGVRRSDVVGRLFWDTWWWTHDPAEVARLKNDIERALAGQTVRRDARVRVADGSLRTIDFSLAPVRDEAGNITALVPSATDITERETFERQLAKNAETLAQQYAELQTLYHNSPVGLCMVDKDQRYLRINETLAQINGFSVEEHIGKRPHELFDEINDEILSYQEEVLRTGKPILNRSVRVSTPGAGLRDYVVDYHPVMVEGEVFAAGSVVRDVTEEVEVQRALRRSEERYRALFDNMNAGFCVVEVDLENADGRIDYRVVEANPAFFETSGFPRSILNAWLREAAPELEEHWYEIYGKVARTGEPARFEEYSEFLERWFDVFAFQFDDPEDRRVAIMFDNITDRKEHEAHVSTLLHEVNHRSKNMLGLVNVIAKRTVSAGTDDFLERFADRINALATNQDILVRSEWKTVDLQELVRRQLAHFADLLDSRIQLDGPPLPVLPTAAEKIGMALHELATNAAKYGALSCESGTLQIRWRLDENGVEPWFTMTWEERGGPEVRVPDRSGFGSVVSQSLLASALDGEVEAAFEPTGLKWELKCPVGAVTTAERSTPNSTVPSAAPQDGGSGVLVVEDDPLLALSVAEMIEDCGLTVMGSAATTAQALSLIDRIRPSCAILDVNLGSDTCEAIALKLREIGVPFICMSGYASDQLPETLRDVPFLPKPFSETALLDLVRLQVS